MLRHRKKNIFKFKASFLHYILLETFTCVYFLQIYEGLQSLLGKPLIVGANNLTWTLVKFINSESCDVGSTKNDLMAEKYSKLSVALSVMHECFEPLKNSFTSKDMIDDVIFNTRSEILIL